MPIQVRPIYYPIPNCGIEHKGIITVLRRCMEKTVCTKFCVFFDEDLIMKKHFITLLATGLIVVLLAGCGILPDDSQAEKGSETEYEGAEVILPETVEPPDGENEISNAENNDNSASYYGTYEVKDYQWQINEDLSEENLALSLEDMESFRGKKIAYQSDSVTLDGAKVADGNFTYKTADTAYNYDSLMESYDANLGEWWNNISEVTCVTINSNESFFGNQFFVADQETIWIYYEGVFFFAKRVDG